MQADAGPDKPWRDEIALESLAESEDHPDPKNPGQFLELQNGGQRRQHESDGRPHVGDEYQDAGDDADRQKEFQSGNPKAQ